MLRRTLRTTVLATVAALGLVGLVPAAAQAAAPAPASVVIVPGDRQLAVDWTAVKGAKKYTVQVSRSSSFPSGKTRTLSASSSQLTVKSLTLRVRYWVRVKAATGRWSAKHDATPNTNSPRYKDSVKVTAAGQNKVKVSWPRYVAGTSLRVAASWSNDNVYTSGKTTISSVNTNKAWVTSVPITRTSVVLTVPSAWRSLAGSRGTEPVFVHLYARNGSRTAHSVTAFGYPSPPPLTGSSADNVTFATWNIASSTATADIPGRSWDQRKRAVKNGILHAGASVLAVQEAASSVSSGQQYQELTRMLGSTYRSAVATSALPVTSAEIDAMKRKGTGGISRSDHILYKPADVTRLAAGLQSTFAVSGGVRWDSSKYDRHFTWALLQSRATKQKFYVVSTHLEKGNSATLQGMRKAAMKGIREFLATKSRVAGLGDVPLVVMGDLNSDSRWPNGPQEDMVQAGYASATQAVSTVQRANTTSNSHNASVDNGYPTRPYRYAYTGTRIDYIFVKNGGGVGRFVNQMVLTSSGAFDERYRGSDHNLQWARIRIS
ncbi:endonuclease/exonuclease/phosphatase family protein [Cellulomonas edaphi]|uniref:Endonuclease/exonuclease/phosphatase family protein n=1 Tax=Cellulomonas edaphi TaxID=3053468 RepID=A0ABT7SAA1_9CELL|nr:endonuclease/exonuclease/phosphatase family protein [Cellulomons edaphi]MDM7832541.1 endonuclease/exonuclease/phosphatase family protein [Cellulomons edaphi]